MALEFLKNRKPKKISPTRLKAAKIRVAFLPQWKPNSLSKSPRVPMSRLIGAAILINFMIDSSW